MFALVLIQGEDTQALLDAMEAKADALARLLPALTVALGGDSAAV